MACREQTLICALKSKQQNSCVPLRQRMKINIKLEIKYSSKFKNMHTQLAPNGQGVSGFGMRVMGCELRVSGYRGPDNGILQRRINLRHTA